MGMLGQLINENGNFTLRLGNEASPLAANGDGSYAIKAGKALGMALGQANEGKVFLATINDRTVILLQKDGSKMILADKITPVLLPDSWQTSLGTYEIANNTELPVFMVNKISLTTESGFLIAEFCVMGQKIQRVILPASDTEGILAGLGKGTGDTVTLKSVNGQKSITISG